VKSLLLASIDGQGLVHQLMVVLIIAVCAAIVWALGRWVAAKLAAPAVVMTVWNGLFLFVGAICVINFLLGLAGHPFIAW
jgi:hypothetical protein